MYSSLCSYIHFQYGSCCLPNYLVIATTRETVVYRIGCLWLQRSYMTGYSCHRHYNYQLQSTNEGYVPYSLELQDFHTELRAWEERDFCGHSEVPHLSSWVILNCCWFEHFHKVYEGYLQPHYSVHLAHSSASQSCQPVLDNQAFEDSYPASSNFLHVQQNQAKHNFNKKKFIKRHIKTKTVY